MLRPSVGFCTISAQKNNDLELMQRERTESRKCVILWMIRSGRATISIMLSSTGLSIVCSIFRRSRQSLVFFRPTIRTASKNSIPVLAMVPTLVRLRNAFLLHQAPGQTEVKMLFDMISPSIQRVVPLVGHPLRESRLSGWKSLASA